MNIVLTIMLQDYYIFLGAGGGVYWFSIPLFVGTLKTLRLWWVLLGAYYGIVTERACLEKKVQLTLCDATFYDSQQVGRDHREDGKSIETRSRAVV